MVEGVGQGIRRASARSPYSSSSLLPQDACPAAAFRICSALRRAGVEVQFDQSELRGEDPFGIK